MPYLQVKVSEELMQKIKEDAKKECRSVSGHSGYLLQRSLEGFDIVRKGYKKEFKPEKCADVVKPKKSTRYTGPHYEDLERGYMDRPAVLPACSVEGCTREVELEIDGHPMCGRCWSMRWMRSKPPHKAYFYR